jgi:hypothetical protein
MEFLTWRGAKSEADRLNTRFTERTPSDPVFKPARVATYKSSCYRSWRRNRFLAKLAERLRKVAP